MADATWEQIQKCPFWNAVDICYAIHRKRLATPMFSCELVSSSSGDPSDASGGASVIRFGNNHNNSAGLDYDVCCLVAMLDGTVPKSVVARDYAASIIFLPTGMYVVCHVHVSAHLRGASVCIYVISCHVQFSFLFLVQVSRSV
jgi:hypothetical protein